ncbi:MAG: VWA domain-containing protein [Terriglobia bacterium]
MSRCLRRASVLLLFLLPTARAQQAPPARHTLRVDVRLVNVEVAVTDAAGNFIPDLKAHNFRLQEEDVPQTLTHFAPTRAPIRLALLIEASPAVFLIRRDHLTAAYHLLRRLRPDDQVALITYARETRGRVDFTRDKPRLEQQLASPGGFGLGMADMRLLDAVADMLDWLSPPPGRTAVLVIGTGLDTGSTRRWEELEQRVGASQVTFFTLATGHLLRGEQKTGKEPRDRPPGNADFAALFDEADARLCALAEASAGQAYFPESAAELDIIYQEIAERLRNLYSLAYHPTHTARDGGYRRIRVELVDANGAPLVLRDPQGNPLAYRVFARPGYFAPRD